MKKIPFISFSVTHTGHVLWRLQLFRTKTDCTETPLGDTGGWWRIPVVLSPTVMGRRGEKGAAHGPPPLPAVHPCAGWGFCANVMLVFWDLFCSLWVSGKVPKAAARNAALPSTECPSLGLGAAVSTQPAFGKCSQRETLQKHIGDELRKWVVGWANWFRSMVLLFCFVYAASFHGDL